LFQKIHFISWQEFLHHVLSKGEAKELILRPDAGLLTIVPYEGAIIRGKRVSTANFYVFYPLLSICFTATFKKKKEKRPICGFYGRGTGFYDGMGFRKKK